MKIIFAGGGTMGPVTPLIAVYEALKNIDERLDAVWVGTPHGPERQVIERMEMNFFSVPVARFSRHASFEWLLLPVQTLGAFLKAIWIIKNQKPDIVASAGGYTAVPMIIIAKLFGIKTWVHQQDVSVTLTTRLTIPFADVVTAAWEKSLSSLPRKTLLAGNPARSSVLHGSADSARKYFGIENLFPTVLVFGGGTGAKWINNTIALIVKDLCARANVIHIVGKGKRVDCENIPNYFQCEYLDSQMGDALALADVVVCRAGMGSLTELAALGKTTIVIPLPNSPQEENASAIRDASVVLHQHQCSPRKLFDEICSLLDSKNKREELGKKLSLKLRTDVAEELALMLKELSG